ncbi:diguanylate cyclase [Oceanimonas sp. CHS3-5]|uniref:GGDEF domain-containing protein n=1 Tax=Oceanimonas sp. CHS3-5 TaxID=3068186 RepID=UPI00273F734B|nr:diguanylate cyclase [Oceanimonas sp. CHS3-5]MDP5292945.1 diguanylate cyclase [Oceanimonas sp. CHS3-5]
MSDTKPLEQQLVLLRERFGERTLTQLRELLDRLSAWQPAQPPQPLLEEVNQLQHRLAGSSGTFGLTELGRQASAQELALKARLTPGKLADEGAAALLDQARHDLTLLMGLLQPPPQPVSVPPPQAPAAAEAGHELLVLGQRLSALADALLHYGYRVHTSSSQALQPSDWHDGLIMLTDDSQLQAATDWNRQQAMRAGGKAVPVLCAGAGTDFASRYQLAELGVDGLFTLPADVPELVERIERLRRERLDTGRARVLLLDDDEDLAERYRLVLTGAGMVARVLNRPEALMTELAEFRPDILLMDIHMPPWSGTTLARMVRFEPQWLSLPIVYLSSEQDRDRQLSALAQGADEFITKPISDERLIRTVSILCQRARQLGQLLSSDGLTGLLNHPHIKQALAQEHARVRRLGHATMVAMLDLDHFKRVNDTHGHATGDLVIRTLAHLLKRRLRHTDRLGRYGGEEFVAVLPDCEPDQARALFEQLCRDFAALNFHGPQQAFHVTVSVGLARLNDFTCAEQGLNAADSALYERKRLGRNGVTDYAETCLPESNE